MKSAYVTIFYLASLFGALSAQALQGGDRFTIDVDYGRFLGNDSLTYVEMYYSVAENTISYQGSEDKFVGGMNIHAIVKQKGAVVSQQEWTAPHVVSDTSRIVAGTNIVGVTSFALPEGVYECEVRAFDFYNPARSDTITFPLEVSSFTVDRVSLSDIEFCTSIRQSQPNPDNVFYKNTLEVIPNVSAVFGGAVAKLHYYVEAYNLAFLPLEQYPIRVVVYDAAGKEVFQQGKMKRRPGNSSVEIGTIDVSTFAGGTYTMTFLLLDTATNVAYASSKKFFMYKPGERHEFAAVNTMAGVVESEFAVMDENDLDADFNSAKYLASESEINEFALFSRLNVEKPRLDAKRNFLFKFWKRREAGAADPGKVAILRKEYVKRVDETNERFSGGYRKGWQTDRGRVYILYGEPSEVDRFPNAPESNPYEIWTYHQMQGGVVFVFIDRTGFGDWVLVHSTHRNEMRDDNWQQYLRK